MPRIGDATFAGVRGNDAARIDHRDLAAGCVGGFIAAALARAGIPVTVVARDSTADVIERDGIAVKSVRLGDFVAHPKATTVLEPAADVLIVATKATSLPRALERIHSAPRLVVPLLNGLDHMALLRQRFGRTGVAAGTIRIEADRPAPARIVQASRL